MVGAGVEASVCGDLQRRLHQQSWTQVSPVVTLLGRDSAHWTGLMLLAVLLLLMMATLGSSATQDYSSLDDDEAKPKRCCSVQ